MILISPCLDFGFTVVAAGVVAAEQAGEDGTVVVGAVVVGAAVVGGVVVGAVVVGAAVVGAAVVVDGACVGAGVLGGACVVAGLGAVVVLHGGFLDDGGGADVVVGGAEVFLHGGLTGGGWVGGGVFLAHGGFTGGATHLTTPSLWISISNSVCESAVEDVALSAAALHGSQLSILVKMELHAISMVTITFFRILVASSVFAHLFASICVLTGARW